MVTDASTIDIGKHLQQGVRMGWLGAIAVVDWHEQHGQHCQQARVATTCAC